MAVWSNDAERINYFATTHTRGQHRAFGVRAKDRDKHFYVIGKSGMGKSTMLENMAIQDIQNNEGIIFVDPHGSSAEKLLDFIPEERVKDTMYLAPFDTDFPLGFNILEDVGYDNRHKVVAGLMGIFERIWADAWSARMQYILQNTLFALLEYPGATIIDVNRMLVNKAFRADVVKYITDPVVSSFWNEEFANYGDRYTQEATPAIQNKIGQFVSNPLIRNILGQPKSTFDMRKMMDERKIVIINLSKGRMGEANAALLGSMLVIKVYLAALTRAEESAKTIASLPPCYFYVDEFQNVVNEAFESILSEARKYKLCLTIANQYIEQMPEEVRNAVFGNVGSTVIFRVGPMDAQFLEPVFAPTFVPEDMVGLGRGEIYLTLMIDGVGSAPFSARTLPPIEEPGVSFREDIIKYTRATYGIPRVQVERVVRDANEKWQDAAKQRHKDESSRGQQKGSGRSGQGPRSGQGAPGAQQPQRYERREANAAPRRDERQERTESSAEKPRETVRATDMGVGAPESRRANVVPASRRDGAPRARSPLDVLRSKMEPVKKGVPPVRPEGGGGSADAPERNALKAAIAAAKQREQKAAQADAQVAREKQHTHDPRAVRPSPVRAQTSPDEPVQKSEPHPLPAQETRDQTDAVHPHELRRILYGEDEG